MKNVAILYIALGRYMIFWKDFFESAEKFLNNAEKHYFLWTDANPVDIKYAGSGKVTVIPAKKLGWPHDSALRFEMFYSKEKELSEFDYIFFFNANLQFYNPTDLSEIAPAPWHDGLVGAIYPYHNNYKWDGNPDSFGYERRPESTAYVPFGKGKHYLCGAFNGGTSAAYLEMCRILAENTRTDMANNIVARCDDEGHLNAYMADKKYLLAGRAYLFPEYAMWRMPKSQRQMIKIISRDKNSSKWGGTLWLRGASDRKIPKSFLVAMALRAVSGACRAFIKNNTQRGRIRCLFGKKTDSWQND
jgi:hypothetical protein